MPSNVATIIAKQQQMEMSKCYSFEMMTEEELEANQVHFNPVVVEN